MAGGPRLLAAHAAAAGLDLADRLVAEHVANEEQMLAPLSPRERDRLAALTRKLLAHLSADGADGS